jgi:hypothetical protein
MFLKIMQDFSCWLIPPQEAIASGAGRVAGVQDGDGPGLCIGHERPAHAALPAGLRARTEPGRTGMESCQAYRSGAMPLQKGGKLESKIHEQLAQIQHNPKLVRSFFQ